MWWIIRQVGSASTTSLDSKSLEEVHLSKLHKLFRRKQTFWSPHEKKHADGNNYHCPEFFLQVFTREDALNEKLHQQLGWPKLKRSSGSQVGDWSLKKQNTEKDSKQFYDIERIGWHNIQKLRTTATYYKVSVRDLKIQGLPNILRTPNRIVFSLFLSTSQRWFLDRFGANVNQQSGVVFSNHTRNHATRSFGCRQNIFLNWARSSIIRAVWHWWKISYRYYSCSGTLRNWTLKKNVCWSIQAASKQE